MMPVRSSMPLTPPAPEMMRDFEVELNGQSLGVFRQVMVVTAASLKPKPAR